jgi:hypothetical protein
VHVHAYKCTMNICCSIHTCTLTASSCSWVTTALAAAAALTPLPSVAVLALAPSPSLSISTSVSALVSGGSALSAFTASAPFAANSAASAATFSANSRACFFLFPANVCRCMQRQHRLSSRSFGSTALAVLVVVVTAQCLHIDDHDCMSVITPFQHPKRASNTPTVESVLHCRRQPC